MKSLTDYVVNTRIRNLKFVSNSELCITRKQPQSVFLDAHMRFSEADYDGVKIIVRGILNGRVTSIAAVEATLSYLGPSDWDKTLVDTKLCLETVNGWECSFTRNELPLLLGDKVLYLEIKAERVGKILEYSGYFNHLGSLAFSTVNKNKIAFLDLTKEDA